MRFRSTQTKGEWTLGDSDAMAALRGYANYNHKSISCAHSQLAERDTPRSVLLKTACPAAGVHRRAIGWNPLHGSLTAALTENTKENHRRWGSALPSASPCTLRLRVAGPPGDAQSCLTLADVHPPPARKPPF